MDTCCILIIIKLVIKTIIIEHLVPISVSFIVYLVAKYSYQY